MRLLIQGGTLKKLILSIILILSASVLAQDNGLERVLTIRDFRGLNTRASEFNIAPNEARLAHNVDLSRNLGAITKRYGYDTVSHISGQDSIVSIYAMYESDGTQRLIVVSDSDGVGYGNIYITQDGSTDLSADSLTRINTYWGIQNVTSFAMFDDNVYFANGMHKGGIWTGDYWRSWPLPAPGEPLIIPVSTTDTVYRLDGEYRYVFRVVVPVDGVSKVKYYSNYSNPVKVSNGRNYIMNLQMPCVDSLTSAFDGDSVFIHTFRTKANQGRITDLDSVYGIYISDTILLSNISSYVIIDSIPDSALGIAYTKLTNDDWLGRDSLGSLMSRYGAPGYVCGHDTIAYDTLGDTTSEFGIFYGIPAQADTLGVAYACTFIDTVTGIESDTGRSLFIWNDTAVNDSRYSNTVSIPKIPAGDSGLIVNLYRALITELTYDTSVLDYAVHLGKLGTIRGWQDSLCTDTIVTGDYHLLAQLNPAVTVGDSIYTDSIRHDSLQVKRIYHKSTPPALIDNIFSFDGRMWGTEESRLWRSDLLMGADTIQRWGQMEAIAFNRDDGDEVTLAYPARGLIRVYKNFSNYNAFLDSDYNWGRRELSGHHGCIAPRSHVSTIMGHYYLSATGVIRETEGMQLERTHSIELISAQLDNFDKLSLNTKRKCVAFYIPDHKVGFCIGDTTYVYDELVKGWYTWGLKVADYTMYGTEDDVDFVPGDTMYFVKPADTVLCKYGTSEFDNISPISFNWRTGALLVDGDDSPIYYKAINKVGLWVDSDDTNTVYGAYVNIRNEEDSSLAVVNFVNLTDRRYFLKSVTPSQALYNKLRVYPCDTYSLDNTAIEALKIHYRILGSSVVE